MFPITDFTNVGDLVLALVLRGTRVECSASILLFELGFFFFKLFLCLWSRKLHL